MGAKAPTARKENRDLRSTEQLGMPEIELRVVPGGQPSTDPTIRAAIADMVQHLEDTA